MLIALAILGAVQALHINREPFPVTTLAKAASCTDPNGCRTLWNIVWSCLVTILLCTWVSVHPNIPGPDEEWPKITLRRTGIMLAALIAPEFVIAWAMRQRVLAHDLANEHKDYGWTVTHGFFALMGGFMEYNGNEPVQTLLPSQLAGYSLTGTGDFPRIAVEDMKDKSKGDVISKGLVILQTGWFIVQCIARASQGLPITELELVTVAFAVLNLVMYVLWWDKPLNVQRAVRLYKKRDTDQPIVEGPIAMKAGFWLPLCHSLSTLCRSLSTLPSAIADAWRDHPWEVVFSPLNMFGLIAGTGHGDWYAVVEDEKRIATFYPPSPPIDSKSGRIILFATSAIAMVFGAIHCFAWPFAFPSDTERILWRVNSVIITSVPIPAVMFVAMQGFDFDLSLGFEGAVGEYLRGGFGYLIEVITIFRLFAYLIARIFLLVLPFLSLRALPAKAYLSVHWTTLIPHI